MLSMNKKVYFYILLITLFCLGILYYAWQQEWIIFRHPSWAMVKNMQQNYSKRHATLYFWKEKWITEKNEVISSSDDAENAKYLLRTLLDLLHEEHIITKKLHVEGTFTDQTQQELFILLDRSPFSKNMSIYQKSMIIESILKTLRENDIKAKKIRFLTNNQPLNDAHLNFIQSWPIEGFV